jgi:hypothetical protein
MSDVGDAFASNEEYKITATPYRASPARIATAQVAEAVFMLCTGLVPAGFPMLVPEPAHARQPESEGITNASTNNASTNNASMTDASTNNASMTDASTNMPATPAAFVQMEAEGTMTPAMAITTAANDDFRDISLDVANTPQLDAPKASKAIHEIADLAQRVCDAMLPLDLALTEKKADVSARLVKCHRCQQTHDIAQFYYHCTCAYDGETPRFGICRPCVDRNNWAGRIPPLLTTSRHELFRPHEFTLARHLWIMQRDRYLAPGWHASCSTPGDTSTTYFFYRSPEGHTGAAFHAWFAKTHDRFAVDIDTYRCSVRIPKFMGPICKCCPATENGPT